MLKKYTKYVFWNLLSCIILLVFLVLQISRWRSLPQFMDIHYHLLTAWGFIQAGGYTGWDFWQYAPVGRIHIYPPLFHIILASLIKLGIDKIILAKLFEALLPIACLAVFWDFLRRNYSNSLAFFALLLAVSSLTFYVNLINHLPATLAIIFGLLAIEQLCKEKFLRAVGLLSLCFYTHIGVSWFFALSVIFYGLLNKQTRKFCLRLFAGAIILSMPVIFNQLCALKNISNIGLNLNEVNFCQFKPVEILLAFFGITLVLKLPKKYWIFLSFFIASFIFLIYPFRFFSTEGYFPIIFLAAVTLDTLYNKFKQSYIKKIFLLCITVFIFFISPTIHRIVNPKVLFFQTNFMTRISPRPENIIWIRSIWFPKEYLASAKFIKDNTTEDDIIYCSMDFLGVCLANLSGRATANGLLTEIRSSRQSNPILTAELIIIAKDENPEWVSKAVINYNLVRIGENKTFIFYKNPRSHYKIQVKKATISFWIIGLIGTGVIFLLLLNRNKR